MSADDAPLSKVENMRRVLFLSVSWKNNKTKNVARLLALQPVQAWKLQNTKRARSATPDGDEGNDPHSDRCLHRRLPRARRAYTDAGGPQALPARDARAWRCQGGAIEGRFRA